MITSEKHGEQSLRFSFSFAIEIYR